MSNVAYSAQTIQVPNPFIPYAQARLAVGTVVTVVSGWCLSRIQPVLERGFSLARAPSDKDVAFLFMAVLCVVWFMWGLICLASGLRRLGRLLVPPRTPADLPGVKVLETVLVRREFNELRLPKNGPLAWIQHYFKDRVIYGTPRELRLLEESIRSVRFATLLALGAAIAAFFVVPKLASDVIPSFAVRPATLIALAIALSATIRGIAIPLLLPRFAPGADRLEETRVVRGGGDPTSLEPLIEQEFLNLRVADVPNRIMRELDTSQGAVADTGSFRGHVAIETQPVAESLSKSPLTWLYLGGGFGFAAVGMLIAATGLLENTLPSVLGQAVVAVFWSVTGSRLLDSGLLHVSRFRYRSTVMLMQMEGTIGRSEVKAGKGWNDSFESANLVVRSDSTLRTYSASLISETFSLEGRRIIVWAERGNLAEQAMLTANRAVDTFERAGIVVRPIEATDGGLNQIAQVNLAYRKAAAAVDSSHVAAVLSPAAFLATTVAEAPLLPPAPQLHANSAAALADHGPAGDTKVCPMCAETVKAAARVCRFCAHSFQS